LPTQLLPRFFYFVAEEKLIKIFPHRFQAPRSAPFFQNDFAQILRFEILTVLRIYGRSRNTEFSWNDRFRECPALVSPFCFAIIEMKTNRVSLLSGVAFLNFNNDRLHSPPPPGLILLSTPAKPRTLLSIPKPH